MTMIKTIVTQRRQSIAFYDTAEECAEAAAPIFQEQRWKWCGHDVEGIPNHDQILRVLLDLKQSALSRQETYAATGRLTYENGLFGHQLPTSSRPPDEEIRWSARREGLVLITGR